MRKKEAEKKACPSGLCDRKDRKFQTHGLQHNELLPEMQDPPSNPNPNPSPHNANANAASQFQPPPPAVSASPATANPASSSSSSSLFIRGGAAGSGVGGSHSLHHNQHHRRAHSEVNFRLPDDMMDLSPSDPFNGGSSTASLEEIGSEDDLFSTYIDVDKLGGANGSGSGGNGSDQNGNGNGNGVGTSNHNEREKSPSARPRHRHSSSVDGSTSTSMFGEIMEAKRAMPPDKLAELWTIDPKRAKRFVFISFSFCRMPSFLSHSLKEKYETRDASILTSSVLSCTEFHFPASCGRLDEQLFLLTLPDLCLLRLYMIYFLKSRYGNLSL